MKKSIYIIGMAAMGLMASCSSDSDYQAVAESTINVLSAQTSLGPNASEGEVTVQHREVGGSCQRLTPVAQRQAGYQEDRG